MSVFESLRLPDGRSSFQRPGQSSLRFGPIDR
jgi:hypothetical protein